MHIGPNNNAHFDSMADLAAWMNPTHCYKKGEGGEWQGHATAQQAMTMLRTGDTSRIAAAEKLLSKFDLRIETPGQMMATGVAGFTPSVPDYLGGSPESMFYMEEVTATVAPLRIIVDPTSSAGITAEQLFKRGTTILAAVMALSAVRPVSLEMVAVLDCGYTFYEKAGGNNVCAIRVAVNSAPLDLGSACYALSHPAFARCLLYGAAKALFASPLMWPEIRGCNMRDTRSAATIEAVHNMLGEDPEQTLFVPSIFLHDELVTNPTKWVNATLERYGQPATA